MGARGQSQMYMNDFVNLEERSSNQIEQRDDVTFRNGAVYSGQWLGNHKHGWGVQRWPDGARYEGNWKNSKASGKGKFWHYDGDVFEGQWLDDKANGYGVYTHTNGASY